MNDERHKTYRPWQPELYRQQAHSPETKLPDGDLVFFLLDTVPQLDLQAIAAPYEQETRGAPPYDPTMMVCLLLYAYAVGVYSSRKIALACERNLAFLAIVGLERPDFRTISDFRKLHLKAFAELFVVVLQLAGTLGMVRLGHLATDGTKLPGNASRHKAMSYGYMTKEQDRLRAEIKVLLAQAQKQDTEDDAALGSRRGDELPAELHRREERLVKIGEAKQRLEQQAREAADAERHERAVKEAERVRAGKKRRGKEPKPVSDVPDPKAQTNFTDPELKIMPQNNKGWEYAANAQATVDEAFQIIVACGVSTQANDKQQAVPMAQATVVNLTAAAIDVPKDDADQPKKIPSTYDNGYFSEAAIAAVEALGLDPHMATGRQPHQGPTAAAEPVVPPATAKEKMAAKLRTPAGKALYARRKTTAEPVFGQIKGARGFRRFGLRGLAKMRGEWNLVCLTHNLLKIWRYRCAPSGN
jgi:transposase